MFLGVSLEVTAKDDAIVVPEEAIVSEGLRHIVYPIKDNTVERRVIRIGQRQNGKVEVVEGLKVGETIVVLGVQIGPGHHDARRTRSGGLFSALLRADSPFRATLSL